MIKERQVPIAWKMQQVRWL